MEVMESVFRTFLGAVTAMGYTVIDLHAIEQQEPIKGMCPLLPRAAVFVTST